MGSSTTAPCAAAPHRADRAKDRTNNTDNRCVVFLMSGINLQTWTSRLGFSGSTPLNFLPKRRMRGEISLFTKALVPLDNPKLQKRLLYYYTSLWLSRPIAAVIKSFHRPCPFAIRARRSPWGGWSLLSQRTVLQRRVEKSVVSLSDLY